MTARQTRAQFWRYGVVGVGSNLLLYACYILLTRWGMRPKLAMTMLYAVGTAQTFIFNKHWSFRNTGPAATQLRRYVLAYCFGYALNLAGLLLLVDILGWAHEVAQGILIVLNALVLFALQKFWVFRIPSHHSDTSLPAP
jgi:putative flippase GtrA